jgi:hypothetical protein
MKEWPPHGRRQTTHISTPASPLRFCLDPAASLRVVGLTAALPLFVRGGCPAQMRARHPRPLLRLIAAPPLVPPNSSARRRSIESSRWSESRNGAASDSKHDPKRGSASRAGAPPPASPHVFDETGHERLHVQSSRGATSVLRAVDAYFAVVSARGLCRRLFDGVTAAQSATIEKRYFPATRASASTSLAESGGACVPRLPGEPISANIPSIPAGEYMNSMRAIRSPTLLK